MPENIILQEGTRAPDFVLTASNGNEVSLNDFLGAQLVLFFYPKDNTPDCIREAGEFRDLYAEFKKAGARIVGVSLDTLDSHNKFISKYKIPYLMLCDTDMKMSRRYGVFKPRKVAGTKVWGIKPTTILLDKDGRIVKIFSKIKPGQHASEVLQYILQRFNREKT